MEPYDVIVNQPVVIDNVSKSFYSIYSKKKKDVEWYGNGAPVFG